MNVTAEKNAEDNASSRSWFSRLRDGLSRSASQLSQGIEDLFTKEKLDDETLQDLEDLLIMADLGVKTSQELCASLKQKRFSEDEIKAGNGQAVRLFLAEKIAEKLAPLARPISIDPTQNPFVILMVGVNGTGKTTTIGKWAQQFKQNGHQILLGAGDTFRAAAVEQLSVWANRLQIPIITKDTGSDPAALAHEAIQQAQKNNDDIVMIDTAGRLHNKQELMAELQKIIRVIQKLSPDAPQEIILTLDATTGQNALQQVRIFREMVNLTGLVVTKLDGTAKGGMVVALADEFPDLPIYALGVGEGADDLKPFTPQDFAQNLLGLGS